MSLEQEIGRLADVLEKIESKMDVESAPKKKKGAKADVVVEPVEETPIEDGITPEDFLKETNKKLLAITNPAVRTEKITLIKAMLKKKYKIESIKAVPVESMAECASEIDTIIGV